MKVSFAIRKGGDSIRYFIYKCPGCKDLHVIPLDGKLKWTYNEDINNPSINPSVLGERKTRKDGKWVILKCHHFLRNGKIQFLTDCTHELAGKTVPPSKYNTDILNNTIEVSKE